MGPFIKPKPRERIVDHDEPPTPVVSIERFHATWLERHAYLQCNTCGWSSPRGENEALRLWRVHRAAHYMAAVEEVEDLF